MKASPILSLQRGHSHFQAKVFHQELSDTAPLDEPQGRLGDSERWMSWEPKAPLAVPDHIGDSTEDEEESEETAEASEEDNTDISTGKKSRLEENSEEEEEEELPKEIKPDSKGKVIFHPMGRDCLVSG